MTLDGFQRYKKDGRTARFYDTYILFPREPVAALKPCDSCDILINPQGDLAFHIHPAGVAGFTLCQGRYRVSIRGAMSQFRMRPRARTAEFLVERAEDGCPVIVLPGALEPAGE